MARSTRRPAQEIVERYAPRLRFPYLFVAVALLFIADLFLPDPIPFVDEVMLALLTFLLGSWRTRKTAPPAAVDVTASRPARSKTSPDHSATWGNSRPEMVGTPPRSRIRPPSGRG